MNTIKQGIKAHPTEFEVAGYLDKSLSGEGRERVEKHIASCAECLERIVSAHEAVRLFKKKESGNIMKKINIYLALAVVSFIMSFVFPRFFLQFLTATLLLGIKWVVDSKSTKMLVMIYEAWKKEGAEGASRVIKNIDIKHNNRL